MDYNTLKKYEGKKVGINDRPPAYLLQVNSFNKVAIFAKSMAGNFLFYFDIDKIEFFYVAEEDVAGDDKNLIKNKELFK